MDIIDSLEAEGLTEQAERLRIHWERKVNAFIVDRPDLFRSEYAFDSTGFESTHALAKYAFENADSLGRQRPANDRMPVVTRDAMKQFLELQMQANLFCRGWLEPAYYYLGSDYRGGGGRSLHTHVHVANGRLVCARLRRSTTLPIRSRTCASATRLI